MVLAADSLISEAFVSEATLLQHEASSLSATFDTLDTYDFFEPPVEVADLIVSAYADVNAMSQTPENWSRANWPISTRP